MSFRHSQHFYQIVNLLNHATLFIKMIWQSSQVPSCSISPVDFQWSERFAGRWKLLFCLNFLIDFLHRCQELWSYFLFFYLYSLPRGSSTIKYEIFYISMESFETYLSKYTMIKVLDTWYYQNAIFDFGLCCIKIEIHVTSRWFLWTYYCCQGMFSKNKNVSVVIFQPICH